MALLFPGRWTRAAHPVLLGLTLLTGAALQVHIWSRGYALWNDELAISLNLRMKTSLELAGPLRSYQVAPVGWLIGERRLLLLFGADERVLRLPSLLGTLLVLGLTALLAHRALGRWGGLLATALVASAPSILNYTGELKQYAVEAAGTLLLLLLFDGYTRWVPASRWRRRATRLLWAVPVALVMPFSYPALIVLAGLVAGLGVWLVGQRRHRDAIGLLAASVPAGAVGGYLVHLRLSFPLMPGQERHFAWGMPPPGSGPTDLARWLPRAWATFVGNPVGLRYPLLVLLLLVAGTVTLVLRGRGRWAAMLGGILLAAVGAAAVQGLPMVQRVALYLVAPTLILVAAGVDGLVRGSRFLATRAVRRWARPAAGLTGTAAATAVLLLVAGPAVAAGYRVGVHPHHRDPTRDALAEVGRRTRPGDLVLVYWFAWKAVDWYGPRYGLGGHRLAMLRPEADGRCPDAELDRALTGVRRIWYVGGNTLGGDPKDYTRRVVGRLAERGTVVEARSVVSRDPLATGPGWVLIDLTAGPDPAPPAAPPDPDTRCLVL